MTKQQWRTEARIKDGFVSCQVLYRFIIGDDGSCFPALVIQVDPTELISG